MASLGCTHGGQPAGHGRHEPLENLGLVLGELGDFQRPEIMLARNENKKYESQTVLGSVHDQIMIINDDTSYLCFHNARTEALEMVSHSKKPV